MSKFLPCKAVCPIVKDLRQQNDKLLKQNDKLLRQNLELRHDVANRDTEIRRLEVLRERAKPRINELEGRLAKVRQAAFGTYEQPKINRGT